MSKMAFRAFAFLDRDGTINEELDIVDKGISVALNAPGKLELISGADEAIKILNKAGYCVVIVTNQPMVAKGKMSEGDVNTVNEALVEMLEKKGAHVDAVYYCPHHPEKGHAEENVKYKIACDCRKPSPGMLHAAQEKFGMKIDSKSFMVGDQTRDVQAGKNAGCTTILLKSGYGGRDRTVDVKADYECANLLEAAKIMAK